MKHRECLEYEVFSSQVGGTLNERNFTIRPILRWLFPILMLDLHLSSQLIGGVPSTKSLDRCEASPIKDQLWAGFNKSTSFMLLWRNSCWGLHTSVVTFHLQLNGISEWIIFLQNINCKGFSVVTCLDTSHRSYGSNNSHSSKSQPSSKLWIRWIIRRWLIIFTNNFPSLPDYSHV